MIWNWTLFWAGIVIAIGLFSSIWLGFFAASHAITLGKGRALKRLEKEDSINEKIHIRIFDGKKERVIKTVEHRSGD